MLWENVLLAVSSLLSNKMRALLTMLGIIIGIMAIITIVIIGDAMNASMTNEFASMGANVVFASVQEKSLDNAMARMGFNTRISGSNNYPDSEDLMTEDMFDGLVEQYPDLIEGVSLTHNLGSAKAQDGELYANVEITGTNADYFIANDITLLSGKLTSDDDVNLRSRTAVVSDKLVGNMFPNGENPIGEQIKVYTDTDIQIYTIIGVYEYVTNAMFSGTQSDQDITTDMFIPVTTAKLDVIEKNYIYISVITKVGVDIQEATDAVQAYFDAIYAGNDDWRINVVNMTAMLDVLSTMLGTLSSAFALIAGISLVVGGIGVMNIMLVSVTERTREIGTRKALGAKNFHIQFQFVTEALIIALVGGIIGMILGILLGSAIATAFDAPPVVSPVVLLGSMLFSMAIGVFFGLYPANKAAKLDPIDALRYE